MTKTYTLAEQKKNREKWVKALRSGRYKQGTGRLHSMADEMCCLGVACRVMRLKKEDTGKQGWVYGGVSQYAPSSVVDAMGLCNDSGYTGYTLWKDEFSLASANDWGASFKEIADIIENEPEGLFRESVQ